MTRRQLGKAIVGDYIAARSTIRTMASPPVPLVKHGDEQFVAEVGQTVKSSSLGSYKAGVEFKVVSRYREVGFCYYKDQYGVTHRNKDIA